MHYYTCHVIISVERFNMNVGRGVKLTTHLHLVLSLRMSGAVPPLSHIKHNDVLPN
jgi:hypothetical protein